MMLDMNEDGCRGRRHVGRGLSAYPDMLANEGACLQDKSETAEDGDGEDSDDDEEEQDEALGR